MRITMIRFDLGVGGYSERVISLREFNADVGAYAINDVPMMTRWVDGPDGGATIVFVSVRGRVHTMFCIEQSVSAYATGIPG